MMPSNDFDRFVSNCANSGLTETQKAVALLWYADHEESGAARTVDELADALEAQRLTGKVNRSRLTHRLAASSDTVRGSARNSYRIALGRKHSLDHQFVPLLARVRPVVSDALLPDELVQGTRSCLEKMAFQANVCYDYALYDACAVICRRMVESLLVEAFDAAGHIAAITDGNGNLRGLDDILGAAKSGQYVKLPRGTGQALDKIKNVGDTAAHDRYHVATKQDVDEYRVEFRKVISQLLGLAGIKR
jgi:hypothetical protein